MKTAEECPQADGFGGGIGTIIIVLIVLLLGGDPSQLLNIQGGTETEQVSTTAEEDQMAQFVSVVLKDTETVWGKIFEQSNQHTGSLSLFFSGIRLNQPVVLQVLPADHSTVLLMRRFILI